MEEMISEKKLRFVGSSGSSNTERSQNNYCKILSSYPLNIKIRSENDPLENNNPKMNQILFFALKRYHLYGITFLHLH